MEKVEKSVVKDEKKVEKVVSETPKKSEEPKKTENKKASSEKEEEVTEDFLDHEEVVINPDDLYEGKPKYASNDEYMKAEGLKGK